MIHAHETYELWKAGVLQFATICLRFIEYSEFVSFRTNIGRETGNWMEGNKIEQSEEIRMAPEDVKRERLLQVFNIAMYGLIEGLWDLFGESSFATVNTVGDKILQVVEKEIGFEIEGDNPKDILMEINNLLVNKIGTMESGMVVMDDSGKVSMACEKCCLQEATAWLETEGVQPFACLPMNIYAAAIRKKLNVRHKVLGRDWDAASETCIISFQILS